MIPVPGGRRVTVREVAAEAGVSFSLVALAFRRPLKVAAKTRTRIEAAAARLRYVPNRAASLLASRQPGDAHRTPLVFLTSHVLASARTGHVLYQDAVAHHARRLGYAVERCEVESGEDPVRRVKHFWATGVQGIIVGGWYGERPLPALDPFAVVCVGRSYRSSDYPTVRHHPYTETLTALRRMRALGYRRVGAAICRHTPAIDDDDARRAAVYCFQFENGCGRSAIPPFEGGAWGQCRHRRVGVPAQA